MATAQRPSAKSGGPPQHESFVEDQLVRASRRLRGVDFAAWALALGGVVLAYGLMVSLADRFWDLPKAVRFAAWCLFILCGGAYFGVALTRLVLSRVNLHFVARRLEQTVPGAKNSVINWLDLKDEPLAPIIRGSLGRSAAKDLSRADTERAISARPLWWWGSIFAGLVLLQVCWLAAAPTQVLSLLQRAFLPFDKAKIAALTALTLVEPESGDIAVPGNQSVTFRVQAEGYVPQLNRKDALKLHFRYHPSEPFEERSLVPDVDGTWTTVVHADQVRNGFWYKITGGDARLPVDREFRVLVRPIPQVLRFEANFKYRDYLHFKDKSVVFDNGIRPNIKELRGTEATLTVRTNRELHQCVLELKTVKTKKELPGQPVPGDLEAWRFQWVLDQRGEFRVLFQSKEGEDNVDREPCNLEVIPDRAPDVVLTKPAKDIALPANGTLLVEGMATDDFGVKSMQLAVKLLKAPTIVELKPKLYRPGFKFQLVNGKYPLRLDYSDFVPLDSLQTTGNEPFPLAAGMELEYWLEARDNCDYPDKNGNLGQSKRYKITIEPPEPDKSKAAKDRGAAQQQAQQNQKKQDSALGDQNMLAKAENDANSGNGGKQSQTSKSQQDFQNDKEKVQKALEQAGSKGNAKGEEKDKGESKDQGPKEGAAGADNTKKNPQDKNPDTPKQQQDTAGNAKNKGQPNPGSQQVGDAKSKAKGQKPGGPDSDSGASKTPPKESAASAKGPDGGKAKSEPGKEKGPGGPGSEKTAQGAPPDAKGGTPTDKSAPKDAPTTTEQIAGAKGGDPSTLRPPADAKPGPPDPAHSAGQGKTGDRQQATVDDVNKLREQLKDPAQRDGAAKALEKIGEQAKDSKVSQAADKALEEGASQPGQSKAGNPQESNSAGKKTGANDQSQPAAKGGPPQGDTAKSKEVNGPGKASALNKSEVQKPGNSKFGTDNRGIAGQDEPASPNAVDEAAARRAGELQLESLKKQIDKLRDQLTPEVLKKLNWTEKEREEFLSKMIADALRRQVQQKMAGENLAAPGSRQSLLPSGGPRSLQRDPGSDAGQATGDRPEAPPEVREPLKIFLGKSR